MKKILILEDDKNIRSGLKRIIKKSFSNSVIYDSGYAREALLLAEEHSIDLFLLDVKLPDYSGIDYAKQLRLSSKYFLTPIIFITALPTRQLEAYKDARCFDYIIKPFDEDFVTNLISKILRHKSEHQVERKSINLIKKGYCYTFYQDDITYLEYKNRKVYIKTINEEISLPHTSLMEIKEELSEGFMQVHQAFVVNKSHIMKIDLVDNWITLYDAAYKIPIGSTYKNIIKEVYNESN